jgi:hypothetical protein
MWTRCPDPVGKGVFWTIFEGRGGAAPAVEFSM